MNPPQPQIPGTEPTPDEARRIAHEDHERATAARIRAWWERHAQREIERTVPKAVEYGSGDLIKIGRDTLRMIDDSSSEDAHDEAYAIQVGILWYLNGKVARALEAVKEGRPISDDTWFDIGVYAKMAQYARERGVWP